MGIWSRGGFVGVLDMDYGGDNHPLEILGFEQIYWGNLIPSFSWFHFSPSIDAGWVEVTLALATGPRVANLAAFSSCGWQNLAR